MTGTGLEPLPGKAPGMEMGMLLVFYHVDGDRDDIDMMIIPISMKIPEFVTCFVTCFVRHV